jgi:hypothetical protein
MRIQPAYFSPPVRYMKAVRIREEARISVNKLGEYLVASPLRRRRIIQDQKKPSDFIVARYRDACEAIVSHLVNEKDSSYLASEVDRLCSIIGSTDWQTEDSRLSGEAIESYLDVSNNLDLSSCTVRRGESESPILLISGVQISIKPDVILYSNDRKGLPIVGAIKLYFPKTNTLTEDSGLYIASMLRAYLDKHYNNEGTVDRKRCYVVDIFGQNIFVAPQAYSKRLKDIEAACQEISRAWPEL